MTIVMDSSTSGYEHDDVVMSHQVETFSPPAMLMEGTSGTNIGPHFYEYNDEHGSAQEKPDEVFNFGSISSTDFPSRIDANSMLQTDTSNLSEDTFSFLIVSPVVSISFFTGILIFGVKATMYTLILADMMTKGTPNNLLGIPAALELPVAVSQILAVASKYNHHDIATLFLYFISLDTFMMKVTVITQDDVITSLQLIHYGYKGLGSVFENTSFIKWLLSLLLLSILGAYGLAVTFLLIITSSDVVDLILNFTAIEFISLLGKFKML
jgi:hypothetical protein